MDRHLKVIGGEHWFTNKLFSENLDNFNNTNAIFLSGGQSAIRFILKDIDMKNNQYILIPSYLCPTILYNFEDLGVKYKFYKVNSDLSIDLDDVCSKINKNNIKAIFFINYFGFYHDKKTILFLERLKNQGIIIIEDSVQMLWFEKKNFIGNYVFNSYRKFLPIDGSIVLCEKIEKYDFVDDNYNYFIRIARQKKTLFNKFKFGNEDEFLDLYEKAEQEYYKRKHIIGMDNKSKKLLSMIDYNFIFKKRLENYCYLYDKLKENNKIKILYSKESIKNNCILGMPIIVENRDSIRKKMREFNIYCPVHWNILKEEWVNKYRESKYLAKRILTLPVDQRYNFEDMNRVIKIISEGC
ncbi:DegT/DnrJ/EryC1/StrS family aminotransferase [Clostridium butyricum]|uniref:DegT/DnrJ/EryC1/StrS family aminotransferase n=2 Tax=Clostridium butyricum TaxID=1492 RepID=UPI00040C6900|nr:DegT/DnrJ/EryC1/StrS family aminotransferase [Clostridium butyricum]